MYANEYDNRNKGAPANSKPLIPSFLSASASVFTPQTHQNAAYPVSASPNPLAMNKSPSLFSSSLPVPAHSPIQTKNQVQKTPPISHSALSFNAQNTQHFYPADSADDYGLDPASTYTHQGVPSSPNHSFSFHNSMSRSHSPAANAAASFDAPPTSSLFDMPQFSGNAPSTPGAVSHSVHSSTAWSPSASLYSNNRLPSEMTSPGSRNNAFAPAMGMSQPYNNANPPTVRILGFPPQYAQDLITHFKSFASSAAAVNVSYTSGSNFMTISYASGDTAAKNAALKEDGRIFDRGDRSGGGVMISVTSYDQAGSSQEPSVANGIPRASSFNGEAYVVGLAAAATASGNSVANGSKGSPSRATTSAHGRSTIAGDASSPFHKQHQHQSHGFHPYKAPAKDAFGNSSGSANGSPQRQPARRASGLVGARASPERVVLRKVQSGNVFAHRANANHASGEAASPFNENHEALDRNGNAGSGSVRPASMLSQVLNAVFGW
ncbi:hypothetical protein BJ741DRAFT_597258 [Chytriomyces cf. hyalinus JEL632]|nr:hypothetical protein BJ741DRAFT_597258 [Chytriomyces cf. hyalinus JEL632]